MIIGKLHLLMLHFPIALLLTAVLADLLWLRYRKEFFRQAAFFCLLAGALSAIPAVATGMLLADSMGDAGQLPDKSEIASLAETHETLGIVTAALAVAAATVRAVRRNRLAGPWAWSYAGIIAAAAVMVSLAGHWGGLLAFGRDYLTKL